MYVLIKGGLHRYICGQNQFTTNENIDRFFVQGGQGGFYFIKGSTYSFVGQMLYMAGKTYFFTKDSSDIRWKLRIYEGSFVLPFKGLFLLFDILIRQSSWWNKNRSFNKSKVSRNLQQIVGHLCSLDSICRKWLRKDSKNT